MAQTLTQLATITSPVTPIQAKTMSASLSAIANLDNRQIKALSVVSLIHLLNAKGGTNYITNHKQLRTDAQNLFGVFDMPFDTDMQESRFRAVLDWNAAYTNDTTITTDVNTIIAEMAGERETPEPTLLKMIFFLRWKLAL